MIVYLDCKFLHIKGDEGEGGGERGIPNCPVELKYPAGKLNFQKIIFLRSVNYKCGYYGNK